jgi:hypothetical protein
MYDISGNVSVTNLIIGWQNVLTKLIYDYT